MTKFIPIFEKTTDDVDDLEGKLRIFGTHISLDGKEKLEVYVSNGEGNVVDIKPRYPVPLLTDLVIDNEGKDGTHASIRHSFKGDYVRLVVKKHSEGEVVAFPAEIIEYHFHYNPP